MLLEIFHDLPLPLIVSLGVLLSVWSWRLWMFTVRPWIWPSLPRELPYWIPFIGHTIGFARNADKVIEHGLDFTNRAYEPFSVQLLGTKFYIVTSPDDVTAVFRNTDSLTFDGHLKVLLQNFGVKPKAFDKAWHKPQPGDWCYIPNNPINPGQLDLIHFVEETYKKQLLSGDHVDTLSQAFIQSLLTNLDWDHIDFGCNVFLWGATQNFEPRGEISQFPSHHASLYSICQFFIVEATARSLFGDLLHDIEPDIVNLMLQFNEHVWMIVFNYPSFFASPVAESRQKIMAALKKLVQTPEEDKSQLCWAIRNITAAMDIVDIDVESRASMMLMSFWAAISNEYNASFWVLAYLLHDISLLEQVKQETEAAWFDGSLDLKYLSANCPLLNSTFHEVLRVKNGAGALRVVTKDTRIGQKHLKAGNSIMIPFRQLHVNKNVWGPKFAEFDPYRFLSKKSLARHPSFRPFGGGLTYCPGRMLAREQVFGFVAILLHRFTIKLAQIPGGQSFPRFNDLTPSLGISGPIKGMDVIISIEKANEKFPV
ncbi:cytochrome P450 [Xylaria telfairii]|nr:cytochrome P450 [Xylaria telfairii]